jgi:hypothetical protein
VTKYHSLEGALVSLTFISWLRGRSADQDSAYKVLKENNYGPRNEEIDEHRVYAIKIRRGNERPTEENQSQTKDQYMKLISAEQNCDPFHKAPPGCRSVLSVGTVGLSTLKPTACPLS